MIQQGEGAGFGRILKLKWRFGGAGATAGPDILRAHINTSSIMVRNAPSIMRREAVGVTSN
jgi:hypothetical protein